MFGGAALRDPDNYGGLKAVSQLPSAPDDLNSLDLGDVATRWDAQHIWVRVDWLKVASGVDVYPDRASAFEKMLEYARSKGWVNGAPEAVRAHWEWGAF